MAIRFLCDRHLGNLAKWLRILGYDTLWRPADADCDLLPERQGEDRIVVTRRHDLDDGKCRCLIVLKGDRVGEQLSEILGRLALTPDSKKRMTLCIRCNAALEDVAQNEVEGAVPAHVYQSNSCFRKCPLCGRIYWPGTHARNIERFLTEHIQRDPL